MFYTNKKCCTWDLSISFPIFVVVRWECSDVSDNAYPSRGTLALEIENQEYANASFFPIHGRFPDYTRIIVPDDAQPHGVLQFNTDYLVLAKKAHLLLNPDLPKTATGAHLTPIGTQRKARMRLLGVPQFEGVLMALYDDTDLDQPAVCKTLDAFVGTMKHWFIDHCPANAILRHWESPTHCSNAYLSRLFHDYVASDDLVGAASILMMLDKRGDSLTPAQPRQAA